MHGQTRRRWSFVIGLLILAAAIPLAGCGSSSDSTGSEEASAEALVETTPAASGSISSFTWDLPYGEPFSLDPAFSYNYSENSVLSNICEGLLRETPQRKIEPALAESVDHPDPLTWVYTIRKGVKYFDGKPLTAADVLFNLERQIDPKVGSYYYSSFGNKIASVEQTGSDEVTVKTKKPDSLVNEMMVTGLGTIVDPKSIDSQGKDFGTAAGTLNCTGPFELEKWQPGSSITLKQNPNYWDSSLQPQAEKVVFKFITDQTALANALVSGEVDGTYEAPVSAIDRLKSSGNGNLYLGVSTQGLSIYPFGNPATEDLKIRQAIYASVDRAGIAETAYAGTATPVKSLASPDASSFGESVFEKYYETVPEPGPDLDRAKKLFEEAGSPSTPIRTAIPSGDPALQQAANAIQDAAKEAGLNLKIEPLPPNQFVALYFEPETAKSNYDMMITTTYYDVPDLLEFYAITVLPGVLQNISEYENPVVSKGVAAGIATTEDEERAEDTVEAAAPLDKEIPYLPLERLQERLYMNERIAGAPATFPYQYYPWAALVGAGS
jgi:peptide/nickel transport system substrate-binding protein